MAINNTVTQQKSVFGFQSPQAVSPFTSGNTLGTLSTGPSSNTGAGYLGAPMSVGIPGLIKPGTVSIPTSTPKQDVKKVVSNADGSQEIHYQPSTPSQPPTTPSANLPSPFQGGGQTPIPQGGLSVQGGNINNTTGQTQSGVPAAQPITGLTTLPNGTVVNASTGATYANTATPPSTANPYIQNVAAQGSQQSPVQTAAMNQAQTAQKAYLDAIQQLQQSQSQEAAGLGAIGNSPIPLEFQQGRAAVLQGEYQGQQAALGQEAAAAASLYGPALSAATTAQGQQFGAAQSAAGLAQPTGQFPFVFNPATGTFAAPGVGSAAGVAAGGPQLTYNPQTDAQSLAQSVMDRKISYNDAVTALSYGSNGNAAPGQLSSAILAKGGNPTDLQAQAAGQAAVAGSIPQLESANTAAQGIASTITSYLQQNPQINASTATVGNLAQQWLQGKQLGDPTYQTFFNYLSEYANTLAPVLGVGGDPTNMKTQIAQGFVNGAASGQSTVQVLNGLNQLATDKIKNLKSGATGGGVVSATVPVSPSSTTTGGFAETW